MTGRTVLRFDDVEAWRSEEPPALTYETRLFLAEIRQGAPDRELPEGATLWWTDGVANEWAEHYPDVPTAILRLAALIRCVEEDVFFKDQPEGFLRWSENFFNQTVSSTPQPNMTGGIE